MKEILVLNQGNTDNIGDIAINDVITQFFVSKNFSVKSSPYWSEDFIFGGLYKYKFIKKIINKLMNLVFFGDFFMKRYIRKNFKNKKFDAIVIGGGDLLSGHLGFCCAFYNWVKYFHKKNIDIYVIGISSNKNMNKARKKRYIKSLKRCTYISARDAFSRKIISQDYGVKCDIHADIVFSYKKIHESNDRSGKKIIKEAKAVIVPINYKKNILEYLGLKNKLEYFEIIKEKIKKSNIKEVIITTTVNDDKTAASELVEYLKKDENLIVKYYDIYSVKEYIDIIKNTVLVISGRMHAMILGLVYKNDIDVIKSNIKLSIFSKEYENIDNLENIIEDSYQGLEIVLNKINEEN